MRTQATTFFAWTSKPAQRGYSTSISRLPLEAARAWSPRMRNLKGALSSHGLASQYGVLAGLRVKLTYGLSAPMRSRPLCPCRATLYPVSSPRGSVADSWETNLEAVVV